MGDFTEWVPVNMRMHTVDEQIHDDSKAGVFFIKLRLIKGYRYKFRYVWRDAETIDQDDPNALVTVGADGAASNYIEVEADNNQTVADFMTENLEEGASTLNQVDMLQKVKSYAGGAEIQKDLIKKTEELNFPNGGMFYPHDNEEGKSL